jgi:hypothetical protein
VLDSPGLLRRLAGTRRASRHSHAENEVNVMNYDITS